LAGHRAVLDLICCPVPKKLLVLLRVHVTNVEITAEHCRNATHRLAYQQAHRDIEKPSVAAPFHYAQTLRRDSKQAVLSW
jgi:uncharacterized protein YbaR (Trm112 family)